MAEENPSAFKVTDRRLFNADGSPREGAEVEEKPAAAPLQASSPSNIASPTAPPSMAAPDLRQASNEFIHPGDPAGFDQAGFDQAGFDPAGFEDAAADGMPEQTLFNEFLMNIASSAFIYMGMVEHPATGRRQVDLPGAQESIEMLLMLRDKTKGNLSPGEENFFAGLLSDLQMQFVALRRQAGPQTMPPPPGSPFGR